TAEWNFSIKDYIVRVQAADILARLDPSDPLHVDFAVAVLNHLLKTHLDQRFDVKFTQTIEHRKQIRLWSSLHLLIPFIPAHLSTHYTTLLLTAIDVEMIVSTRYYIEWALMRVLLSYPTKENLGVVWERLGEFEGKAHVVSSLLGVVMHVGVKMGEGQVEFYDKLFTTVLPWTTSNHFTIRLFAQYALHKAVEYCRHHPHLTPVLTSHPHITATARFISTNTECARHRAKCDQAYFMGGGFDPVEDVNLEFLYRGALAVAGVAEDERISAMAFEKVNPAPGRRIPLRHPTKGRDKWTQDSTITLARLTGRIPDSTDTSHPTAKKPSYESTAPVQKKIVPWEIMMESDIDLSMDREDQAKKRRHPLVVVASLVSKAPNLGGLCRTCEIFGAELLVVSNLKIREDQTFQTTAVTAHHWMPILEVKEPGLESYLLDQKRRGYALLGIEQATTSVSLETFEFPEKCVLVLGKEKEGIPVPLLPLLDYILEIPQYGVVRSLNVHVSGALIVWEYTKQRVAKGGGVEAK
ncbi:Tar (HIV-1) RNA binding protein 1, partial [Borealophlyctis nickersoniae]